MDSFQARLHQMDETALLPVVRAALQDNHASIVDWSYESIGNEAGLGAYKMVRLSGSARIDNHTVGWSVICKAINGKADSTSQDATAWNYWKREALVYQSSLLSNLASGIDAPTCYGVEKVGTSEYWIWLEDLGSPGGRHWSFAQYGIAARHLGQFNGAYLTEKALPDAPWLSQDRAGTWVQFASQHIYAITSVLGDAPLDNREDTRKRRIFILWEESERLLHTLQELPQCLCHHDALPRNLFLRRSQGNSTTTTAIDWAMVGIGSVGQEIAAMLGGTMVFLDGNMDDAEQLEKTVFSSYLDGLRDAGWQGDSEWVRFGYSATLALVWGLGLYAFIRTNIANQDWIETVERVSGNPYDVYLQQTIALVDFALDKGDEALALLDLFDHKFDHK